MPGIPHDPYSALRSTNYLRFALGFVSAATGLQMVGTAIGWEIYERTGDPLDLGYIGLARALPVVILALPAGHLADHFSRRLIVVLSQTVFAASLAALALCSYSNSPLWTLYLVLVATACARAFNGPARGSLLPTIVAPAAFHNAVTWNSGFFHFAALAGPLLAGAIIALTGVAWPVYALAALGNLAFAILASGIKPLTEPAPRAADAPPVRHSLGAMLAGMGHLWREKTILGAITLDLVAVLLGGATALLPVYAKDILHVGPVGLGVMRAAPFAGALLMALVLAHRPPFRRAGPALLWAVAGFGAATIVFGLATDLWLALAALFALGAIDNISVVIRHVLVQVRTPDHLRGRVGAVNSVFIECSNELGAFESGLVAALFTPVISVVSGGIGTIIVVALTALALPELRRLRELHDDAAAAPVPQPGT